MNTGPEIMHKNHQKCYKLHQDLIVLVSDFWLTLPLVFHLTGTSPCKWRSSSLDFAVDLISTSDILCYQLEEFGPVFAIFGRSARRVKLNICRADSWNPNSLVVSMYTPGGWLKLGFADAHEISTAGSQSDLVEVMSRRRPKKLASQESICMQIDPKTKNLRRQPKPFTLGEFPYHNSTSLFPWRGVSDPAYMTVYLHANRSKD